MSTKATNERVHLPWTKPFAGVEGRVGDSLPEESRGTKENVRQGRQEKQPRRLDGRHHGSERAESGPWVASDRNTTPTSVSTRRELIGRRDGRC